MVLREDLELEASCPYGPRTPQVYYGEQSKRGSSVREVA